VHFDHNELRTIPGDASGEPPAMAIELTPASHVSWYYRRLKDQCPSRILEPAGGWILSGDLPASAASPKDAKLLSDLAAAYLELSERKGDPTLLLSALEAADRAVDLDPQLPEASFNRALSLQKLFLWTEAGRASRAFVISLHETQRRLRLLPNGSTARLRPPSLLVCVLVPGSCLSRMGLYNSSRLPSSGFLTVYNI